MARPNAINLGPHQARAPATKATAVHAAVDMTKLLLKKRDNKKEEAPVKRHRPNKVGNFKIAFELTFCPAT